jgi:hypothetical protein
MAYWEYDVNYKMRCETKSGKPGPVPNCNMNCIYNWTTSNATYNPSGLAELGGKLGAGWMFYLHMYCADSPMWQRFDSIGKPHARFRGSCTDSCTPRLTHAFAPSRHLSHPQSTQSR